METSKENDITEKVINVAGDVTGAAIGAGIGMAFGGPVGAVGGAAIGSTIKEVLGEVFSRTLFKKERERITTVTDVAKKKIEENLAAGRTIRDDGFFDATKVRSSAEEICEGILVIAQKEYEEKKNRADGKIVCQYCI